MKLTDGKILVYLALAREFEVSYNPDNSVAVDINENNVTLAVFIDRRLHEVYRVETNIGRIVIAYSERRRKIAENRSTKDRVARKALRKLREGERKEDIVYKTACLFETGLSKATTGYYYRRRSIQKRSHSKPYRMARALRKLRGGKRKKAGGISLHCWSWQLRR